MDVGHPGLAWLRGEESGSAWLDRLPRLVEECAERWELRLGEPFAYATVSLVFPAIRRDGTAAVLKVQFPDRESEHEAAALRLWDGHGAVCLLAHDPQRHALLLERCLPGTALSQVGHEQESLDVFVGLLPRLWKRAGSPFQPLAAEAARWARSIPANWARTGEPFERRLVDVAVEALRTLSASQGEHVLLHQDLHSGNVLRAQREQWLVIDPKPLVGEREFSVAPIVRAFDFGRGRQDVYRRFDQLTSELGLDRERARLWTVAQTVAWSFGAREADYYTDVARWLLDRPQGGGTGRK